jgi:hypothetical protein
MVDIDFLRSEGTEVFFVPKELKLWLCQRRSLKVFQSKISSSDPRLSSNPKEDGGYFATSKAFSLVAQSVRADGC